jgi:hypothetical protein
MSAQRRRAYQPAVPLAQASSCYLMPHATPHSPPRHPCSSGPCPCSWKPFRSTGGWQMQRALRPASRWLRFALPTCMPCLGWAWAGRPSASCCGCRGPLSVPATPLSPCMCLKPHQAHRVGWCCLGPSRPKNIPTPTCGLTCLLPCPALPCPGLRPKLPLPPAGAARGQGGKRICIPRSVETNEAGQESAPG